MTDARSAAGGLLLSLLVSACQPPAGADRRVEVEYLDLPGSADRGLPFSAAVRVDNMLYLSGVIGTEPGTLRPVAGGIQAETRRAMQIIGERLQAFGSSMDRVVKCTVFLADMDEWSAMNEVYVTFFDRPPARSALGASGLARDARLEIECIATVD